MKQNRGYYDRKEEVYCGIRLPNEESEKFFMKSRILAENQQMKRNYIVKHCYMC